MSENHVLAMVQRVLMLRHGGKLKGMVAIEPVSGEVKEYPLESLNLIDNSFVSFFDGKHETLCPISAVKRIVLESANKTF